VEPNNFGAAGAPFLLATFTGEQVAEKIQFEKTYDGAAGVSHNVSYVGTIVAEGRHIVGAWSIGAQRGQFELAR